MGSDLLMNPPILDYREWTEDEAKDEALVIMSELEAVDEAIPLPLFHHEAPEKAKGWGVLVLDQGRPLSLVRRSPRWR
jgi:hypothetical protein